MPRTRRSHLARSFLVAALTGALGACAVAPPRTSDPLQSFNRKMFAFNQFADKVAIRPVAKGYTKVTGPKGREHIGDFFANLRLPVTIINDVLQGRLHPAFESTGRFLVNTSVGVLGFMDPATQMGMPAHTTDFGVTLAHWGVPSGPYLVLPFIGPTTLRDVWRLPVDSYFDPLGWYARDHDFNWHAQYAPTLFYLVTVRASLLPYDQMLDSAYDPYAFMRDAYLQRRLSLIYYGNPPLSAIEELQGTSPSEDNDEDIDQLLQQQREYEKTHAAQGATPAAGASTQPAPAASAGALPAAPASVAPPASSASTPPASGG